jgi:hypothetical protein
MERDRIDRYIDTVGEGAFFVGHGIAIVAGAALAVLASPFALLGVIARACGHVRVWQEPPE